MKVLVTGARGMLGQALAIALDARGDEVTLLQRNTSGLPLPEVLGDVTDSRVVTQASAGKDAVIHLAAKVSVTGEWSEFERVNVFGTQQLIAAAARLPVFRGSSTSPLRLSPMQVSRWLVSVRNRPTQIMRKVTTHAAKRWLNCWLCGRARPASTS